MRQWIIAALVALAFGSPAFAQEGTYQVIIKKQEQKKTSRWTLAEWLAYKERARMMDLWLAKNSHSSPFEFYLDGGSINTHRYLGSSPDIKTNQNMYYGGLGAFAGIVGIQGRYESYSGGPSLWQGGFNLRILGRAIQDTHINLEYGLRGLAVEQSGTTTKDVFQNQFGGVNAAFYLTKFFGVEGAYRRVLPAQSDETKRELEGESSEAGVFIDFSFVRVYGRWKKDYFLTRDQGAAASEFREGIGGGLKFFF